MAGSTSEGSRARDGASHRPEVPPEDERHRLARGFGMVLRHERERLHLTQSELAACAGLHAQTVYYLEAGLRRPTTTSVWRLARALRPRRVCTLRDAVAVDERLRRAAGFSLRRYGTRPHAARERVRAELLAEAGDGAVGAEADDIASLIIAGLVDGST